MNKRSAAIVEQRATAPLRVLLVEDRPSDAELIALFLEDDGFLAQCRRVETEDDFLAALDSPFDVVLSDWSLPRFSGLRALELLRERDSDLPFIIVSGSVGEEVAIDALHMGADDYVLKDRLARLGVAIRRAFDLRRTRLARRRAEREPRLAAEVFESSAEGVMITDPDQCILRVNRAFTEITGYSAEEAVGRTPALLHSGEYPPRFYRDMWATLRRTGRWSGEIWNKRKDGSLYPEWLSISTVRDEQGTVRHYVGVFTDISQLKQAQNDLEYLSQHDALTGLPNRLLLEDRLRQAMRMAGIGNRRVALLLMNLDRLQRINESLGHAAGDTVLKTLARRLEAALAPGDSLARLGSDEFVMVLTDTKDNSDVMAAARRLLDVAAEPCIIGDRDLVPSVSIGISVHPGAADSANELIKQADAALNHAKDAGRNRFSFYTPEMNLGAVRWLDIDSRLRQALTRGELSLHYQPKIGLIDGRIRGAEALLRWHNPDLGSVGPGDFVPLAEDTGQIVPIGAWVLASACAAAALWPAREGGAPTTVAVNVSARQVLDDVLPAQVARALSDSGLTPSALTIELTETVLIGDGERAARQLRELAAMGVRLSLDDFGTGYSSLSYLSRFPFHELKIDRSFVKGIDRNGKSAAIANATIALARGLGIEVVAEGVETPGELAFLRKSGCAQAQGYLFGMPVPEPEFALILREGAGFPLEGA